MDVGESVTLAALKRSSLCTSNLLPTHIYACTVRLRYPAGNREVAFPVDQVSGPTYIVSLRKACISPLLHPETASPFQGLYGIRTAPLRMMLCNKREIYSSHSPALVAATICSENHGILPMYQSCSWTPRRR